MPSEEIEEKAAPSRAPLPCSAALHRTSWLCHLACPACKGVQRVLTQPTPSRGIGMNTEAYLLRITASHSRPGASQPELHVKGEVAYVGDVFGSARALGGQGGLGGSRALKAREALGARAMPERRVIWTTTTRINRHTHTSTPLRACIPRQRYGGEHIVTSSMNATRVRSYPPSGHSFQKFRPYRPFPGHGCPWCSCATIVAVLVLAVRSIDEHVASVNKSRICSRDRQVWSAGWSLTAVSYCS